MFPGWMQILLVVVVIVLLFGRGKISDLMGDVAKGIRSFRTGLSGEDEDAAEPPREIESETVADDSQKTQDKTRTS